MYRQLLPLALSTALVAAAPAVQAQEPIRLVVAFTPGGPVDIVARTLADPLGKILERTVIVENRPGANGNIAASYVAKAAKDGSTLFLTSVGAVSISPALYANLPYDPQTDFAPVSRVVNNATVFVVAASNPATDAKDYVERAKAAKQPPAIGSSGVGSIPHLTLEMFRDASGAPVMHVPYKGASQVIGDVIGGHADGFFGDVPGLIGQIRAGALKPLGLASAREQPALPNVKTLAELGIPDVESNNWYGLLAPAGTPEATIERLNQAVRDALAQPDVQGRLEEFGAEVAPSSPQELAELIESDRRKWTDLIERKQIQP
ncbi:tripartite tricarboxylate transporter substrate binding protein [Verticiella sediminum]|uniref:Tripartite tricarboxylate transporter substrate binding protein n=1 Tax=Verticiella sediminum TaxID=1247510 RepID=A0A556B0A3_9BURK|nr:tripartite tricarboxylate transporter substrate binding protein [Verticiella sediminum]TSH98589.1 tripartite tricarboxylate transporter substrate binding protein [Verticiella sediminum]